MLPILRILPVGGVLLAIMLLVLALNPPAGTPLPLAPNVLAMRGAMMARSDHPEWRQFLMLAAIQRAEELNRLRELPDSPARSEPAPAVPKVAVLPKERSDTDPEADDQTGSIVQLPAATIPIEIGETSSFELPVATPEEQPPVIRTPLRIKSRKDSEMRLHARRAKAAAKTPASRNLFEILFGDQKTKQPPTVGTNER